MLVLFLSFFFFFKQKTAYEMRISDWSSDVCSSDLHRALMTPPPVPHRDRRRWQGQQQDRRVDALGKRDPAAERRSEQDGERQGEAVDQAGQRQEYPRQVDRKSTRLNSSH